MDESPGVKFEDLKKEERYKKLERNLKLAFVKQMEQAKAYVEKGYCTSPTWPSLSTINPDGLDTTGVSNPLLQVSRVESEVVSSSSNLHKVLAHKRTSNINRLPMTTSSVKKFPLNDDEKDRAIMPPPPSVNMIYRNQKTSSDIASKHVSQNHLNMRNEPQIETQDLSIEMQSGASSSAYQENDNNIAKSLFPDSRGYRVFHRWRVMLNDQGSLIIKGTLDCGKVARSKPVIQRFSSTKVQSVFKHIYVLDGQIVDERNELPNYVRGKFHNGFPDDWENVYQLWRNYVAEGSKITFRWPTPIADSDDDLITEITDFTYSKNKQVLHSESLDQPNCISGNNGSSSGYHSKNQSDSIQNLEKSNEEKVKVISTLASTNRNNSVQRNNDMEEASISKENDNNRTKDSSNLSANCSKLKQASYLNEIIREDKLRIICSNLGDSNCPPQYLDKFIELIDCLRYLLSITPKNETDFKNSSATKNQVQSCQKCNSTVSFSETQELNLEEPLHPSNKNENSKFESTKKNSKRPEYIEQIKNIQHKENSMESKELKTCNVVNESSDSDTYMGIPNVSFNRVIKSKTVRNERYRDVKNRIKEKKNINRSPLIDEINIQDERLKHKNDSSVSITEDEYELRHQRKRKYQLNDQVSLKSMNTFNNQFSENVRRDSAKKGNITPEIQSEYADSKYSFSTLPSSASKMIQKSAEKSKPVIKNSQIVHLNLKLKSACNNEVPLNSDISILDDDISIKRQKLTNLENVNKNELINDEKLTNDILQHPFLTYDSEDFPDVDPKPSTSNLQSNSEDKYLESREKKDPVENKKILRETNKKYQSTPNKIEVEPKSSPSKKKKISSNTKTVKNGPFGSKENPKLIASWIPCVMYNEKLKKWNLKFEGKLLNEAGHVLSRKFITEFILKRHSATLVETVDNEYFMLVGELNNTKHVVPKELLRQCRTGCPTKIQEFCDEWNKLKSDLEKCNKIENLHNTSISLLSVPTSARGRKILPPLHYWNGERVVTKDLETVYYPGDVQETTLSLNSVDQKKPPTSTERSQSKKEINPRSNKKSSTKTLKSENKVTNSALSNKPKQRMPHQLKYSENDSSENETTDKKSNINLQKKEIIGAEPVYNTKLRKRQKVDSKQNVRHTSQTQKSGNIKTRSKKSTPDIMWTCEKQQLHQDVLSDDQSSVVIN